MHKKLFIFSLFVNTMFSGISFAMDNNGGDPSDSNNNGMLRKRERAADTEEPNSKKKQTENTIILNNLNANPSALSLLDETSREFIKIFQSLRFDSDCDEKQKEDFIKEILVQNNPFLILQMIKKIIDNRNLSIDFGADDDFWSYLIAALNTLGSKNYDDFLEISKIFDTTTDSWNSEHYADFVKIYNLLKNKFPCGKGVYNILKRLKDAIKLDLYPYEFKIIIKALLGNKQYIFYEIPLIGAFCNSPFYNRELFDSFIETLRSHYKSDDFKDNGFKTILDPVNVEKMLDQRHKKNIKALIHHSEQIIKTLGLEKKDIYDSECFFSLMQLLRQVDPFKYDAIIRRALKSEFSKNSVIYRYEKLNERYYLSLRQYQNLISILNLIDPIYYNKFDNEVFQCAYHFTHDKGFGPDILVKILSRLQNIKGDKTKIMDTDSFIQYGDQIKKLDDYIKQLKDKMNFDDIQHIKIFLDIIEFKNHDPYHFKTNILHYIKNIGLSNVDDLHKIINTLSYSKDPNQIFNQKCFEVDPIIQDRALDNRILNMLQYIDLFPWLKKVHAIRGYFQLPDAITKVTDLEILDFSSSYDFFVPDLIGNLKNLKELHIWGGISVSLPKSIGNLKNLKKLSIKIKTLTSLPESIGNLENLETIFFDRCQLTSLPESIGNLINLRYLSLDGNNLTTIPASIANLRNLTYLDLQGNPYLLPRSDNPLQWGKEELRAHFGDRVKFDEPFLEPMPNKTNKMDVYSSLDKQTLRINRNVFAGNKLPKIKVDKVFNGYELIDVLEEIMTDLNFYDETKPGYLSYEMLASDFASDAKNQNLSNHDKVFQYLAPRLTGYIRALYKLPLIGSDVKPWKMYKSQISETQKALTFIMDRINHTIDPDAKMLLFNLLVNGLLHCPTGQAEGINSVAYALSENGYQTNNFKDNLKRFLSVKKNAHFTTAILAKAAENSQNVHLISSYRDQLKDELGLNAAIASYEERMGTMGQDPFAGNKWNVVQTFYGLVSPDRLIDWVMQASETRQDADDLREELGISGKNLSPADREKEILRLRAKTRQNRQFRPFTTGSIAEYLYLQGLISDDENNTKWQKYFTADPLDTEGAPAILTRDGAKAILIHEGFLIEDSIKDEMIVDKNTEENTSNNFNNWNSIDD